MSPIEAHLLKHGGWVPASELCRLFAVSDRELRMRDGRPGLCSDFAISGNAGLKHVDHATDEEWELFYGRMRRHSIGQFYHLRRLRSRRRQRTPKPATAFDARTGQGLLLN